LINADVNERRCPTVVLQDVGIDSTAQQETKFSTHIQNTSPTSNEIYIKLYKKKEKKEQIFLTKYKFIFR